jgi:hypothetical protein
MKMRSVVILILIIQSCLFFSCKDCPECPDQTQSQHNHSYFHEHQKLNYSKISLEKQLGNSMIYEYNVDGNKYYSIGEIDNSLIMNSDTTSNKYGLFYCESTIPKGIFGLNDTLKGNFLGIGFTENCPKDKVCTKLIGNKSCYLPNGQIPAYVSYVLSGSTNDIDTLVPMLMEYHEPANTCVVEYWKLTKKQYDQVANLSNNISIGIGADNDPIIKNYTNIGRLRVHNNNSLFIVINPNIN